MQRLVHIPDKVYDVFQGQQPLFIGCSGCQYLDLPIYGFHHTLTGWAITLLVIGTGIPGKVDVVPRRRPRVAMLIGPGGYRQASDSLRSWWPLLLARLAIKNERRKPYSLDVSQGLLRSQISRYIRYK
jgi:hypothetical protein